jgi:hypothetical protein
VVLGGLDVVIVVVVPGSVWVLVIVDVTVEVLGGPCVVTVVVVVEPGRVWVVVAVVVWVTV